MDNSLAEQLHQSGVSIIIQSHNAADQLKGLLSSFLYHNTHHPFEIIVMVHASNDHTEEVIHQLADNVFFVHIICDQSYPHAVANNFAAHKAVYPNLLFLNKQLFYGDDLLSYAAETYFNEPASAIGIGISKNALSLPYKKSPDTSYSGGVLAMNTTKENHLSSDPIKANKSDLKLMTDQLYPLDELLFLLCKKDHFLSSGGFRE